MIKLRDAVFVADKNNSDVEGALNKLRGYVYAHMNTNLSSGQNTVKPPIQLKYTYERLSATMKAKYAADTAKVLADATAVCTAQVPGKDINIARLNCAQAYAATHPVKQQTIPEDLYKFDFASPFWSPDLAGWSILIGAIFLLLLAIRILSTWIIDTELKSNA